MTKLTQQEYLDKAGLHCPVCDSMDIDSSCFDGDGTVINSDVFCNSCDSTWKDIFMLVRFENLKIGEKK